MERSIRDGTFVSISSLRVILSGVFRLHLLLGKPYCVCRTSVLQTLWGASNRVSTSCAFTGPTRRLMHSQLLLGRIPNICFESVGVMQSSVPLQSLLLLALYKAIAGPVKGISLLALYFQ